MLAINRYVIIPNITFVVGRILGMYSSLHSCITQSLTHPCAVVDVRWRYTAGRQLRVVSTDLLFTGCRLSVSELVRRYARLRSPVSGAGVSGGTDRWLSSRPSATPPSATPLPPWTQE